MNNFLNVLTRIEAQLAEYKASCNANAFISQIDVHTEDNGDTFVFYAHLSDDHALAACVSISDVRDELLRHASSVTWQAAKLWAGV